MADERTSQTPIDQIIGQGADAGPAAESPRAGGEQQPQPSQPSVAEAAGIPPPPPEREERPGLWAYSALKDERAKRQAFQEQSRQLQEERDALLQSQHRFQEQSQQYPQQPQQQQPTAEDEFWASPEGFIEKRMKQQEANFSFRLAHEKYGDDFEHAWSAMIALAQNGDPSVVRWTMSTPDPGVAMMKWYEGALQQQRHQQRGPVMPSNFTGARNVGSRRGPAWSGPTSLEDIFDRGRNR